MEIMGWVFIGIIGLVVIRYISQIIAGYILRRKIITMCDNDMDEVGAIIEFIGFNKDALKFSFRRFGADRTLSMTRHFVNFYNDPDIQRAIDEKRKLFGD